MIKASTSIVLKNETEYSLGDLYFERVENSDKIFFYISNSDNDYEILIEESELLCAIETVTENSSAIKSKIAKEILDQKAIAIWDTVFLKCQCVKSEDKIAMANAAVDGFYNKFG